jgi:1,4-alpha-glucan branching enzyme
LPCTLYLPQCACIKGAEGLHISASPEPDLQRIAAGCHHDPHSVLGPHDSAVASLLRAYFPATRNARLADGAELTRRGQTDFFEAEFKPGTLPRHPRLQWTDDHGRVHERVDPYSFAPTLSAADLQLFGSGGHVEAWRMLGAHAATFDDVPGVRFAVWAPNAERVSVVGPFCNWDGRALPMRVLGSSGVWEIFIPGLAVGAIYKYEIRSHATGGVMLKTDPYARQMEMRPATAAVVVDDAAYRWQDGDWMQRRPRHDWLHAPMSIYEVHAGSWQRHPDGRFLTYRSWQLS